jgi:hypothetical protein
MQPVSVFAVFPFFPDYPKPLLPDALATSLPLTPLQKIKRKHENIQYFP